jgi:hypothetical protein
MKVLARGSQIWQIRVLTAKLRRLLKQAVPVVMLAMQVIDETNHAGTSFRRTSRLIVPIYGNSADEQNGPPMNGDKRRRKERAVLIGVYPRSSAAKYRRSEFSSRPANRWSTPHARFPERDVSSGLWIAPQSVFKAPQRVIRFWLCESTDGAGTAQRRAAAKHLGSNLRLAGKRILA